jgi:multiple sugar transport system ATP-binding protein
MRPPDFEGASLADAGWARMPVAAGVAEALGSEIHVLFSIDAPPVAHSSISDAVADGDSDSIPITDGKLMWTARLAARSRVQPGRPAELAVDTSNLHFFDPDSGLSVGREAPVLL